MSTYTIQSVPVVIKDSIVTIVAAVNVNANGFIPNIKSPRFKSERTADVIIATLDFDYTDYDVPLVDVVEGIIKSLGLSVNAKVIV